MTVHNHPPYRPMCPERVVNGHLRGECMDSGHETIRDQAAIRASWDGDCPDVTRIVRRVGAALNSGRDKAVVDVVLDEVAKVRGTATDDELAHRLDWATGRNGRALLEQIRAEGLDVIAVRPEQANA